MMTMWATNTSGEVSFTTDDRSACDSTAATGVGVTSDEGATGDPPSSADCDKD